MKTPTIIFKDEDILVVEKPAGMPSVSLKENEEGTLASWLLNKFPKLSTLPKGKLEAGLVHRLDNDTSGIVLVARTDEAYEKLRAQFLNPPHPPFDKGGRSKCPPFDKGGKGGFHVLKEYLALVVGNPPAKGIITTPIAHHPRKKKKMVVSKNGRPAVTKFRVIKILGGGYALIAAEIKMGVRHQIRVHLASEGFPIAGDKLYQNPKKRAEDTLGLKRHFLHASKLGFTHPRTNEWTEFSSDLPEELKEIIAAPPFPYQDHSMRR